MSKVVVLGGSGGIGSVAVRALAALEAFDEIVVADLRLEAAEELARQVGSRARAEALDVTSPASLEQAMRGASVVLNCVGPFYRFGPPILRAAIEAGVDYVDVCDDLAPTRLMLELDGEAKRRGVTALVGMGNSPGLANVFVKLCRDLLLDVVETVDIMHIHGGEPTEGPAVLAHRIHAMLNDVPLFLDGQFVHVRQLEESGRAHVREADFRHVGRFPVYPYPHPETITLPTFLPGLRRATNLGVIFPLSYFHLTQEMVRVGACGEEPLEVNGQRVVPIDFSIAHILSQRARLLREAGITGPRGCLRVECGGTKDGRAHRFVFQLSSAGAGAGEGTGIPAAVGAALVGMGAITDEGVLAPEACVSPLQVFELAMKAAKKLGMGGNDSVQIESIDADGTVTVVPLSFG
ncbi:MAG: saccharopine dehydrogenase NADP-binding domain-containing protein [Sandaracinus sp.]